MISASVRAYRRTSRFTRSSTNIVSTWPISRAALPSVGQRPLVQRLSDKPCHILSRFFGCRPLHGTVPKTTGQPANGSFHYHSHANDTDLNHSQSLNHAS